MQYDVKIVSLELENVKRVRAVALSPSPEGLTVIGGRNAQGKTSVLDGIAYALGGEKFAPSRLQYANGLAPARIEVKLSNGLVVRREGKSASLKVSDPSGKRAGQKLLNEFITEFALNLPKFMLAGSKDKAKTLLHVLGIEDQLDKLDREEQHWYDERTLASCEADRKQKYADELTEYPDAPAEPLSGADVTDKMTTALARNAAKAAARAKREKLETGKATLTDKIADLKKQLQDAEARLSDVVAELQAGGGIEPDEDVTAIQAEIERMDATNAQVRTNLEKSKAIDEAQARKAEVDAMTAKVEDVRCRRMALLKSCAMPLDGLSVSQGELVYNGQQWDCMSTMEQCRVAVAICKAVSPGCGFVLLDHLEAFDPEQIKEFDGWLTQQGLQAIATRVATDDTCDIIIEDGMVASSPKPDVAPAEAEAELGDW